MGTYERMAILAEMNESIWNLWKWGEKFQKDMRNIQRHNWIQMLKIEPEEPRNQMLKIFKMAEKEAIKDYKKSVLIDRRWLSDWSLECTYQAPDWTIWVDVVQENTSDDYQYEGNREKSKAWDEKIEKQKRAVERTFTEFWSYFTGSRKQKENKKLLELYS